MSDAPNDSIISAITSEIAKINSLVRKNEINQEEDIGHLISYVENIVKSLDEKPQVISLGVLNIQLVIDAIDIWRKKITKAGISEANQSNVFEAINKLIIIQRNINKEALHSYSPFLAENRPEATTKKKIVRRNVNNILDNISSEINQEQQDESQEEEQEEQQEQQQEEQQLQLQEQRQLRLAELEKLKNKRKLGVLEKKQSLFSYENKTGFQYLIKKDFSESQNSIDIHLAIQEMNREKNETERKYYQIILKEGKQNNLKNIIENSEHVGLKERIDALKEQIDFYNKKLISFDNKLDMLSTEVFSLKLQEKKICYVSQSFIDLYINNFDLFKSGIILEPLPPGFILYENEKNPEQLILDFTKEQYEIDLKEEAQEEEEIISPRLKKPFGEPLVFKGNEKQFIGQPPLSKEDFALIQSKKADIHILLKIMKTENIAFLSDDKIKLIESMADLLKNKEDIYNLTTLVEKYGAEGPYIILKSLNELKTKFGPLLASKFYHVYLEKSIPFCEKLLTYEGSRALSSLMDLSEKEFGFFIELSISDSNNQGSRNVFKDPTSPNLDLDINLNNFRIFNTRLKKFGINLDHMPTINFNHGYLQSINMAVTMQRIITILDHSIDPIEQFKHIGSLDLTEAYQAITEEGYFLVTKEMRFDDTGKRYAQAKANLQQNLAVLISPINDADEPLLDLGLSDFIYFNDFKPEGDKWRPNDFLKSYYEYMFLRAVGKTPNADRYPEYKELVERFKLSADKSKAPYITSALALALAGFATLHEDVYKIDPKNYDTIFNKLTENGVENTSLLSYLHLIKKPEVKRPKPEQLVALISFHQALGENHSWNLKKGIQERDNNLYVPNHIAFLKSVEKLGDNYFEVIHQHLLSRSEENANKSAKNIPIIAEAITDKQWENDPFLNNNKNNLFKILSYCDFDDNLDANQIYAFVKKIKKYDKSKIDMALETLSILKFKSQNATHPSFTHLEAVFESIEKSQNPTHDDILKIIRQADGFKDCAFTTKEAAEYSGDTLKEYIQNYIPEIKAFYDRVGIDWKEEFENPKYLIEDIKKNTEGMSPKAIAVKTALGGIIHELYPRLKEGVKGSVEVHINQILNPSKEEKNIEQNRVNAFLKEKYFEKLNTTCTIDGLSTALDALTEYEKQAAQLVDHLGLLKTLNPTTYKNTVKHLHECTDLNKISLETLNNLIDFLLKKYKNKFPSAVIKAIVSHPLLSIYPEDKLNEVLNTVVIQELINKNLLKPSEKELNAVIQSIITIGHHNVNTTHLIKIVSLLKNKESKTELISVIHNIAKNPNSTTLINNIIAVANLVEDTFKADPQFISSFYTKFGKNIVDLSSIGKYLSNDPIINYTAEEKKHILLILSKTEYNFKQKDSKEVNNRLENLLEALSALPINPPERRMDFLSKVSSFTASAQMPFPNAEKIISAINEGQTAELLLEGLKKELHYTRNNPETLANRFNTSQAERVLNEMEDLNHDTKLGYIKKKRLYEQFHIVNHLGYAVPLSINLKQPNSEKKCINLMGDDDIKLLMSQYRDLIRDPNKPDKEKNDAKLVYLALLRESMYRATNRFPFSTQIIAVLNALNQNGNNLAEIQTGEGKSLISSLYAAMLHAEGQAVDIATSTLDLAKAGLNENKEFYHYIGVKATLLTAESDLTDEELEGIHYSDVPQLALHRSRVLIEGGKLPSKASLVLDETDYTLLDDKTQYRYAASLDSTAGGKNKFEALYEIINDFIDDINCSQEPQVLREYLISKAMLLKLPASTIQLIKDLDDKQLDTWIDSAIAAQALYQLEGKKWALKTEVVNGKERSVAHLILNNIVSPKARWSNGIHQFLHARINTRIVENNKKAEAALPDEGDEASDLKPIPLCHIEPETSAVASISSKNFIDFYNERNGKIWGITGTIGSKEERQEHADKYGYKQTSIPPHKINQRITRDPILIDTNDQHKEEIFNQILKRIRSKQKMPALIICKDSKDAEALHAFLSEKLSQSPCKKQYPLCLQLVSATTKKQDKYPEKYPLDEETLDANSNIEKYVEQAGIGGTITISTPMLGRGTDFKPVTDKREPHPHGLFVLQTYLDIRRTERQGEGRTSRQGAKGEAITILSKEALEQDLKAVGQKAENLDIKKKELAKYMEIVRNQRNISATEQRKQIAVLGDIRNIYFKKMLIALDGLESYYNSLPNNDLIKIRFSNYTLYRIAFLKRWEGFLLDLDLKKAILLKDNPKLTIHQLAEGLLKAANVKWEDEFSKVEISKDNFFSNYIQNIPDARPLSPEELTSKTKQVVKHAYASRKAPPPVETTRALSKEINKDKLVCKILDNSTLDRDLVYFAMNYELNLLYLKALKLTKVKTDKKFSTLDIPDRFQVLHAALYKAYSDERARSPNSPKVYQYWTLINKLEKEANWIINKNIDSSIQEMMLKSRENHCYYLIQQGRSKQLFEFQRNFTDIPLQSIFSHSKENTVNTATRFKTKLFQDFMGEYLANDIVKSITKDSISYKGLLDKVLEHRNHAYFGTTQIKPLPTNSKHHQIIDNILMGYIASSHKSTLERVYQAEIKDIYILLEYINRKYPNNTNAQNACKDLQNKLEKNILDLSQIQKDLVAIQLCVPSKALRNNLSTKMNHLNEISIRKSTDHLQFKKVDFTDIQFAPYTPKVSKMPKIRSFKKVSPSEDLPPPLIHSQIHTPSPNSEIVIATNSQNEPTAKAPISLLNKILPQKEIVYKFGKKTNSGQVTMAELRVDKTNQSARITKPLHVKADSADFLDATKKAIDKIISLPSTNSETLFTISSILSTREQIILSNYITDKLRVRLPNIDPLAIRNQIKLDDSQADSQRRPSM